MSIKIAEKHYLEESCSDYAFTGIRKSEGNVTRYNNAVNQTIRSNINFLRVRVMESVSGIQQKVEQNISKSGARDVKQAPRCQTAGSHFGAQPPHPPRAGAPGGGAGRVEWLARPRGRTA